MTFADIALIIGSIVMDVLCLTALITILLRRRATERPRKPWLQPMLDAMAHADRYRGRLNPLRLPIERM